MNIREELAKADRDQATCDKEFEKWWNSSSLLRRKLMPDQDKEQAQAIFAFGWMGHQYPGAYDNKDIEKMVAAFLGIGDDNGV